MGMAVPGLRPHRSRGKVKENNAGRCSRTSEADCVARCWKPAVVIRHTRSIAHDT